MADGHIHRRARVIGAAVTSGRATFRPGNAGDNASVSAQNVEAVRRSWDAFNRGDLDAFFAETAEDIEFEEDPALPEAGVFRGRSEISAYIASFQEGMADHRFELDDVRDLGDRVLALLNETGRGASSGIDVQQHPAFLYEFSDGLIVRVRAYLDRAEGLAAVGLG